MQISSQDKVALRVLMLNRGDMHRVPGGDTVQMLRTKDGLEKLGVQVELHTVDDVQTVGEYDLVHIFNWQQVIEYFAEQTNDSYHNVPVVLSPIFWFHTGQWFNSAAKAKVMWQVLRGGLGAARSQSLYELWQQTKFRYGPEGRALRRFIQLPARLLPNSSIEVDYLESVLGLPGELKPHSTIVPNAVVKEQYDPLPAQNQAFIKEYGLRDFVLQAARIQAAKNQLGLIEALYDLPISIVFAGQPSPYEQDYVKQCYELGKQRGNVYFLGSMTSDELAGIYVLATVHVLPSWRETPGLASLEAAASGCRIVSTSIGSAWEYFGNDAEYCDPREPASIRQAVVRALDSPPPQRLRERILQRYTWQNAAEATLGAYEMALGDKLRV